MSVRLPVLVFVLAIVTVSAQDSVPRWQPAPPLTNARASACAVKMSDGRVLVTGGSSDEGPLDSAELFRSAPDEAFEAVPGLIVPRSGHVCVVLGDGRVFVAGGEAEGAPAAEVYDPSLYQWSPVTSALQGNRGPGLTATLLNDGRVLLIGGLRAEMEVFDPDTGEMQILPVGLGAARQGHTATLLSDGRVLITGGRVEDQPVSTAELYDPSLSILNIAAPLNRARSGHTATLLSDSRVLIAGGTTGSEETADLEVFTPDRQVFEPLAVRLANARQGHVAVLLESNGAVLLAGGSAAGHALGTTEIFEPWHDAVSAAGSLTAPRVSMTAVTLEDGRVLAMGGRNADGASRSCGTLRPTIVFAFTQARYRPLERATIKGSFIPGVSGSATATLQLRRVSLTTGVSAAANDRLLVTSLSTTSSGTLPTTPVMNVTRDDIGHDFTLTAFFGREAIGQAKFGVRLSSALTLTPILPVLAGQPVRARLVLTADGAPVEMSGSRTLTVGTRSAATIGLSSVQTTSQSELAVCCEANPGVFQTTGRFSGNVFLEPATVSTTVAIGSRTPTVRIVPTALRLLQAGQIVAEVLFDPASIDPADPPRGNVVLRNSGVTVAALPLATNLALDSGVPRGALFSFTPSLIDRRKPPCFTAHYDGDERYTAASSAASCIAVGPAPAALEVSMGSSSTYTLGERQTLTARLTWPDSVGIVGRTVNVSAGTTPIGTITLAPDPTGLGIATGSTSVTLPFQTTSLTFTYPQSGDLSLSSNTLRTAMGPIRTTMTASVPSPTTNPFAISYRLQLNTGGAAIPPGTALGAAVQFFDGAELLGTQTPALSGATSIADGTSNTIFVGETPSFSGLFTNVIRPLGQRNIRARFPGSALFQAAEIAVPVTVR